MDNEFATQGEALSFDLLIKKIAKELNFHTEHYKKNHLKRRVDIRIRATGCDDYTIYARYLTTHPEEKEKLFETLAVNVTNFFRNETCFDEIKSEVIPFILAFKAEKKQNSLRIWSAGCSSGEEIYSIAIILKELLGDEIKKYEIKLLGTEIDTYAIEDAKIGIYKEIQLREINPIIKQKYFTKEDDKYRISEEIKNMVEFKIHDIIKGGKLSTFDLILCRNVMIYFERDTQEILFNKFYDELAENGFLVIGSSETMPVTFNNKFRTANAPERIYQKI